MSARTTPVRIAINNDYAIVVAGVTALLEAYSDRVAVVEVDLRTPTISDVDIILYDTFGQDQGRNTDFRSLTEGGPTKVVVFNWNLAAELIEATISAGAAGYLWKGMPIAAMVDALEAIHAGQVVTPPAAARSDPDTGAWPGKDFGLTAREAEIVALVTQGLTNQEIADKLFLSINSIKTYIRTAYRKMRVVRRSQAVAWGLRNGFGTDRARITRPDGGPW